MGDGDVGLSGGGRGGGGTEDEVSEVFGDVPVEATL